MNISSSKSVRVPQVAARKKSFGFGLGKKFNYVGSTEFGVVLAHEIGHAVAYLQNTGVVSATATVFSSGGGVCEPEVTASWRDQATLSASTEYCVAGCVFEYMYVCGGDISVAELYQRWLNCSHSEGDRVALKEEVRVKSERLEQLVLSAIERCVGYYHAVGGEQYIKEMTAQAWVEKGNLCLRMAA